MSESQTTPITKVSEHEAETFFAHDSVKLLREHNDGEIITDLDRALHDLVKRVTKVAKKGTLTLQVTVDAANKGDGEMLSISAKVTTKLPEPDRRDRLYFPTPEGGVSRHHPNQLNLAI